MPPRECRRQRPADDKCLFGDFLKILFSRLFILLADAEAKAEETLNRRSDSGYIIQETSG